MISAFPNLTNCQAQVHVGTLPPHFLLQYYPWCLNHMHQKMQRSRLKRQQAGIWWVLCLTDWAENSSMLICISDKYFWRHFDSLLRMYFWDRQPFFILVQHQPCCKRTAYLQTGIALNQGDLEFTTWRKHVKQMRTYFDLTACTVEIKSVYDCKGVEVRRGLLRVSYLTVEQVYGF